MSAPANHHSSSGRFARSYYLIWGLFAAGGLAYLASFVPRLDLPLAAQEEMQAADPQLGLRVANEALSEVGSVRQSVNEMRKDIGQLKQAASQRDAQERESQARIASLEERVTALGPSAVVAAAPAAEPAPQHRSTEQTAPAADNKSPVRRATPRVVAGFSSQPTPAAESPQVETGSIPAPPPVVAATFGAPKVTPAREQQSYSVQVAAGPSLDALRLTWSVLTERHGALAVLKPRYVAPKAGASTYRLVAGPLASRGDAEKVCADMRVGPQGCLPTTAVGEPL